MNSSGLKFLVDVGVGKGIEVYLNENGYDTKAVRDLDPSMEDEEIVRVAVLENRMIITMDKDFGELVYHSSTEHSGVLLLRLEDATGATKLQVVKHILNNYGDRIGNYFCVFQKDKLRIRKMPRKK